jgi:hypothetical protein
LRHVCPARIRNPEDLCLAFGCTIGDLARLTGSEQNSLYHQIRLPKKGKRRRGQYRIVYKAIDQTLRLLQKNVAEVLAAQVTFAPWVQGFVAGRSIVSNARQHLARRVVLTADIEHFFESISADRVSAVFSEVGFVPEMSRLLAKAMTLNGRLVQGSSASPILANLVCRDFDADLVAIGSRVGCTYTRYADDITMSGDTVPGRDEIAGIFDHHGFRLRDNAVRVQRRGRRQYVTGLSVFDPDRPRIPRAVKRRLRLELYYGSKHGLESHFDYVGIPEEARFLAQRHLEGWIKFMWSVEPERAAQLAQMLDAARAGASST